MTDFAAAARRSERGRHVHDQHGVVGVVVEQMLERHGVAFFVGVAGDVDRIGARPDRRQRRIELLHGCGRNVGELAAEIGEPVHRQNADAAAIGQDRQPLAGKARQMAERLRGGEQLVEIEHAQQAGAAERGVIDRIRAGQRPGMRHRRFGALRMTSAFDDQHRLGARGGARRRHEFARVLDRLDVEQNRPRRPVHGEIIEQVGKIDVDAVADGDDGGESDAAHRCPFHEAGRDGAGLRDQREVAGARHRSGKAGIELDAGNEHAEAIRSDEAQPRGARGFLARFRERAGAVAETRGEDDRGRRALGACGRDGGRNGRRRHADHGEIRRARQVGIGFDRANALDGVVMRIDQLNVAGKAAAAQIFQDGMAGRLFPRTGADDNDGSRRKRFIETIDRHPLSEFSGRLGYDLVGFMNEFKTAMPGTRPGIPILSIATDASA